MASAYPVALTVAGSDSCGGAGIAADLKTFTVLRAYGAAVVTAVTAQNTTGVQRVQMLAADMVRDQIDAVAADLRPAASKTGMLGQAAIIRAVADAVTRHALRPLVVDPVMAAKSGDALIDPEAVHALASQLLPLAALTTPNRHEAARLLGAADPVATVAEARDAARDICRRYRCAACVVKGVVDAGDCVDVLFDGAQIHDMRQPRVQQAATHGSGCAFSAAITAHLAHGLPLVEAVRRARRFIQRAIADAPVRGRGVAPVEPLAYTAAPTDPPA